MCRKAELYPCKFLLIVLVLHMLRPPMLKSVSAVGSVFTTWGQRAHTLFTPNMVQIAASGTARRAPRSVTARFALGIHTDTARGIPLGTLAH